VRRFCILVLLLVAPLAAQEGPPMGFFREPDHETARDIANLVSSYGIGSSTRDVRTDARRKLREIGRWSVPTLRTAVARKESEPARVRMNAVMALSRILDPSCLPELREVAESDRKHAWVRTTTCLGLGLFGDPDGKTVPLLRTLLRNKRDAGPYQRTSALSLGRIESDESAAELLATLESLPGERPLLAASIVLAASVRTPDAHPEHFLDSEDEIVRRAAAIGLLIRPLPSSQASVLLDLVRKPASPRDRHVRPMLYHALAAVERTDEIRDQLLRCATRSAENKEVRVAAILGLATEWGITAHYKPLKKALQRGRNDPVAASMLFALAQTGEREAVGELIKVLKSGSGLQRVYAAGSLLYLVSLSRPGVAHPDERTIFDAIGRLRGNVRDSSLRYLVEDVAGALNTSDAVKRAERARSWFRDTPDPYRLHLWDWTRVDRSWAAVNDFVTALLELDDIADKGDPLEGALPGGDPGLGSQRNVQATPEEVDMLDFLRERPAYFGPGDLGDR
jgi:HEAT repeat protein